jgi:hypothetical protein
MKFRLFGTRTFFASPFGFAIEGSRLPVGGVGFITGASSVHEPAGGMRRNFSKMFLKGLFHFLRAITSRVPGQPAR